MWGLVIALASVAPSVGGDVYWQYRTARPPALDSIPAYLNAVAVPVTDIPEQQRAEAERELRQLASTARADYRMADERPPSWMNRCSQFGSLGAAASSRPDLDKIVATANSSVQSLPV